MPCNGISRVLTAFVASVGNLTTDGTVTPLTITSECNLTGGDLSNLTAPAWLAAMGVFGAFGAFTVLFWAWFRFRPSPVAEGEG